jgi:hypothetical protein
MDKQLELEFLPGETVYQMIGAVPVETRIRAYQANGSLTIYKDKDGVSKEEVSEAVVYSTLAQPNKAVTGKYLGRTKEELAAKLFGISKPQDSES